MKKVHTPNMVAHLWANKSQPEARVSANNFYFVGDSIYSYGSHHIIATHLPDGSILWNNGSATNTTARHTAYVRQALSSAQRASIINVPSLKTDTLDDLLRVRASGEGRKLPMLAKSCGELIVHAVQNMSGKRLGAGPISGLFRDAKALEQSADKLRAFVAKGKRMPAWSIPRLPDALPETKEALEVFIRAMAKPGMVACHAGAILTAQGTLDSIVNTVQRGQACSGYEINNLGSQMSRVVRECTNAQKWHLAAHGKKSTKATAIIKTLDALQSKAQALIDAQKIIESREEARRVSIDIFRMFRRNRKDPKRKNGGNEPGYYSTKLQNAVMGLTDAEKPAYADLIKRVKSCGEFHVCFDRLERARSHIKTADSYVLHPLDAKAYLKHATGFHAAFDNLHGAECTGLLNNVTERLSVIDRAIAAKHARAVSDWQEGVINSLPFEAGTYARIKGESVQTSHGATVPIAHACRLARIARRVIAAGGKTWSAGEGPMVGGFRVNSIGADGACVIGCHEFSAAESNRIMGLLEACAHCVAVTADEVAA